LADSAVRIAFPLDVVQAGRFVEGAAELFVEHHVRRNGKRLVHAQGVAQSHHLQAHRGNLQVDLDRFRRHMGDALDDFETFVE